MSLTEASDPDMQVKFNNLNDKQSKNGDDQVEGMGVSDTQEFTDPAILEVREIQKIKYTREELIRLREAPLSQKKPDFFDTSEVSPFIFDTERWNFDRKKSDTPTENGPRTVETDHRRRPGDPRERLRKENDGIVLSPQRRSFNSGCFVPVRETRTNRPHSPLGKNDTNHIAVREIQPGTRRIGSGRILRDPWDYNEKSETGDNEFVYNRGGPQRNNDREEKFGERRSFGRDFDMNRDKEKDNRRNGRYSDRRRMANDRDEEPEWFSSGPISQNDTIELRGFDEPEKTSKKKMSPSRVKRYREWVKKKSNETQQTVAEEKDEVKVNEQRSTSPQVGNSVENQTVKNKDREFSDKTTDKRNSEQTFNFDEILQCDTIPGLLPNGEGGDGDNSKSRFSRFFATRASPEKIESRRSSLQEDNHIIKDLLKDIGETSVSIPGDSESYFAPISPAANTGGVIGKNSGQSINIMEMLQQSKQNPGDVINKAPPITGNILSLDELEAKMRQGSEISMMPQKHPQKPDEEMAAFKKLLAQANINQGSNVPKIQPMSLMEMLNHSQQQDEARASAAQMMGSASPNLTNFHHPANDINMKLQKQQLELINKFMNVHGQVRTSPLHDINLQQQSRELLNRPEAQAILQGLKRGEITIQHIYQQLLNPALQPRHREMLATIVKLQGGGMGPSPRVLSPVPPHIYQQQQQQQQQQQLRVSPLPPNSYCVSPILATSPNTLTVPAMHQRIPSPRELQVHTQNILQRALIKKKLEEQQENYRKKQELQQRGQSPNTSNQNATKSVSSPTQFTFTPTSVLRKMTADKDEGKENKGAGDSKIPQGRALTGMKPPTQQPQPQPQWNQQYSLKQQQQPAGRPIVKANPNYQTSQSQSDQYLFQQQQRLYNQISNQSQQPRKPNTQNNQTNSQYHNSGNNSNANTGPGAPTHHSHSQYPTNQQFPQQLTQQQLRAQHQQHARPVNQSQQQHQHSQMPQSLGYQPNQHSQPMGVWQQFLNSAQQNNRSNNALGRGGLNDGDISPTTNQLARWFSPDLLERARVGELPSTAGLGQHALSLEEIERQTAPPVHN